MEEAFYKELKALAQEIIDMEPDAELATALSAVRKMEEKLILLDYLRFRSRSMAAHREFPRKSLDQEVEETLVQAEKLRDEPSRVHRAELKSRGTSEATPKPNEAPVAEEKLAADQPPREVSQAPARERETPVSKQQSVHQNYTAGQIILGLNDRLAFTNHLFEGNQEDLNRVISQLNTFASYNEAEKFLMEMVKPDYDWGSKGDYEERFVELVKARFGEE